MKTDLELIQDVKSGLKNEFAELVERHEKFLLKVVVRMTRDLDAAEDIVQEAFIKAFRRLHLFEGRSSFRSWLYQIALNTARNRFRRSNRESIGTDHFDVAIESESESQMIAVDVREVIQKEVDKLPERQRMALILCRYENKSYQEIAVMMNCSVSAVESCIHHAKKALSVTLKKMLTK